MSELMLSVHDIVVDYPGHPPLRAVDSVSFDIHAGEVVGLVGESGCGKSTMAKVITGLLAPNAGEVVYRGRTLKPLGLGGRAKDSTGIQMVFQDPGSSLNPRRRIGPQIQDGLDAARRRLGTVGSGRTPSHTTGSVPGTTGSVPSARGFVPSVNGSVPGEPGPVTRTDGSVPSATESSLSATRSVLDTTASPLSGDTSRPTTVAQWLERVGMSASDATRFPRSFSGGQRQRIATARALAAAPDILVADEPISSLDASTQALVAYIMSSLTIAEGAGMLFISHDLSVVRLIADRLLVMYKGRIVERGRAEEVWADPRHPYTQALLKAIPLPDGARKLPHVTPPGTDYPLEEAVR